jgi:hypothetical protein
VHYRYLAILFAAAAAACSSGSKPPEEPKPAPAPVEPTPPPEPAVAPVAESCPKLVERFRVESSSSGSLDPTLLDAMIGVVNKHCPTWPAAVVSCLVGATEENQNRCMQELDAAQLDAFEADVIAVLQVTPSCADAIAGPPAAAWKVAPASITDEGDLLVVHSAIRATQVPLCEAGWSEDIRACIAKSPSPHQCLEPAAAVSAASHAALAPVIALYAKAAAFKPSDKKIACAKVAAAHYGDKQWKGKLADRSAADRKKLIKASTAALTTACTDDQWSPFVRACVVAAKTEAERGWCLDTSLGGRWAYPAAAAEPHVGGTPSTGTTGVPACDQYIEVVTRYAACPQLPAQAREATLEAIDAMRAGWSAGMPDEAKKAAADGCAQAIDALRQSASAMQCPL